jgi:hypothetical protein
VQHTAGSGPWTCTSLALSLPKRQTSLPEYVVAKLPDSVLDLADPVSSSDTTLKSACHCPTYSPTHGSRSTSGRSRAVRAWRRGSHDTLDIWGGIRAWRGGKVFVREIFAVTIFIVLVCMCPWPIFMIHLAVRSKVVVTLCIGVQYPLSDDCDCTSRSPSPGDHCT